MYEPTVFENYVHDLFIDGQEVQLSLWDTAGQEEFDRLRSLSYSDTHCIMLCFSIDLPDSLENVKSRWAGEIAEHCDGVKLVLVALKCDLRLNEEADMAEQPSISHEDELYNPYSSGGGAGANPYLQQKRLISYNEGLAVARKVGALRYLECSAKKNKGVNEAFSEAARCALNAKPKGAAETEQEKKSCVIM